MRKETLIKLRDVLNILKNTRPHQEHFFEVIWDVKVKNIKGFIPIDPVTMSSIKLGQSDAWVQNITDIEEYDFLCKGGMKDRLLLDAQVIHYDEYDEQEGHLNMLLLDVNYFIANSKDKETISELESIRSEILSIQRENKINQIL